MPEPALDTEPLHLQEVINSHELALEERVAAAKDLSQSTQNRVRVPLGDGVHIERKRTGHIWKISEEDLDWLVQEFGFDETELAPRRTESSRLVAADSGSVVWQRELGRPVPHYPTAKRFSDSLHVFYPGS